MFVVDHLNLLNDLWFDITIIPLVFKNAITFCIPIGVAIPVNTHSVSTREGQDCCNTD